MSKARAPVRRIIEGDCAVVLPTLPAAFARLVYVDPPFNTRKVQRRDRIRARSVDPRSVEGAATRRRGGFAGRTYEVERVASASYADDFDDYVSWLVGRVALCLRCTTPDASIFVHLDAREVHYVKVALDTLLGRDAFINEIIWAYDFGGRSRRRWPAKHDTILWYARDPERYVFDHDAIDRIPYMAPGLVTPEKAARGKTPTDVWWHTIVPTSGREKTGYPTQKPLGVVERIVKVHSEPGDVVLDFFAGSGTTGDAAAKNGRGFVLVDESPEAVDVAARRLAAHAPSVERGSTSRG
ncbi:MAG: site-specific DNA-methyltransferase [Myxococcales bacterium]|nr:site-specific DNA-methyltransferase [Myxococcales bacterium]